MTKLYAPPEYWECSPEIIKKIVNGCGPKGWKGKLIPDSLLCLSIKIACDIHDWMYFMGKTEEDRAEADRVFRNNMHRLIIAGSSNRFTRAIRYAMAEFYYYKVRSQGAVYFWASKNLPETFRDPMEVFA